MLEREAQERCGTRASCHSLCIEETRQIGHTISSLQTRLKLGIAQHAMDTSLAILSYRVLIKKDEVRISRLQ
jgi:hypothetical protein